MTTLFLPTRARHLALTALLALMAASGGCTGYASSDSADDSESVQETLLLIHFQTLTAAERQRALFQERIRPGMTREDVVEMVRGVASEVVDSWYDDGQPETKRFDTSNGESVEVWEYEYYDKTLILSFQDGALTGMTDAPRKTMFQ